MDIRLYTVGELTPLWDVLRPWFDEVSHALSGRDYGGPMEHLWIEVELHEYGMNIPDRPPWPFRFQKRVSPRLPSGLGPVEAKTNVGHYAVRPTGDDMRAESHVAAGIQVLAVVVKSTEQLVDRRQIRGFDVARFRSDLAKAFEKLGLVQAEPRRMAGHPAG